MPILEKAYAKFNGNYAAIDGGWAQESFRALTNSPCEAEPTKDKTHDEIFAAIDKANKRHWLMTASCRGGVHGLSGGHLYSVLGAVVLKTKDGPVRLIEIRNPWGTERYNGPWSDDDKKWTDELRN